MSVEQRHHRTARGRQARPTYFVGRRQFEAAEVYEVSGTDVHRLRSAGRYEEPSLDWQGGTAARMELSHVLISRVAKRRPSRELQTLFAVTVLSNLSDDGFILDSDEIQRWLLLATDEKDLAPAEPHRRSLADRLRTLWRGGSTPSSDV